MNEMNDDELERILRREIVRRIDPPPMGPAVVREHALRLGSEPGDRRPRLAGLRPRVAALGGLAAALAIAALIAGGLFLRSNAPATTFNGHLPAAVDGFGRIDAKQAWAAAGRDLFTTRDGGASWRHGMLPAKGVREIPAPTPTLVPTPCLDAAGCSSGGSSYSPFPSSLMPFFVDADHGWLVSWSWTGSDYMHSTYTITVHRTSDGGQTWQSSVLPGVYRGFGIVQFVDPDHGYLSVYRMDASVSSSSSAAGEAIGGGPAPTPEPTPTPAPMPADATTILATSDGGATWTKAGQLGALAFPHWISPNEAWGYETSSGGVNIYGTLIHTTDAGKTWSTSRLDVPNDCYTGMPLGPDVRDGAVVFRAACADTSAMSRAISQGDCRPSATAAPTDAGHDASPVPEPSAIPNDCGTASPGRTRIFTFTSGDGGKHWSRTEADVDGYPMQLGMGLSLFIPSPAVQPIVVGDPVQDFSLGDGTIRATFDGGKTWRSYSTKGLPAQALYMLWSSPDDVWAETIVQNEPSASMYWPAGRLYGSTDGSKTWRALLGSPAWPASPEPTPSNYPVAEPSRTLAPGETPAPQPIKAMVEQFAAVDAKTGWALIAGGSADGPIGPALHVTSDGGKSWATRKLSGYPSQIQFVDATHGWQVDGGPVSQDQLMLGRTTDGGTSWSEVRVQAGAGPAGSMASLSVHFLDAEHGYALVGWLAKDQKPSAPGQCRTLATQDGGVTWTKVSDWTCSAAPYVLRPTFTSPLVGFMMPVTEGQVANPAPLAVWLTLDGGKSWTSSTLAASLAAEMPAVLSLDKLADGSLAALVSTNPAATKLQAFVSRDGGASWTAGRRYEYADPVMSYASAGNGRWMVWTVPGSDPTKAKGHLLVTADAGTTWKVIQPKGLPTAFGQGLSFVDDKVGWGAFQEQDCAGAAPCGSAVFSLYKTTDGGATWSRLLSPLDK